MKKISLLYFILLLPALVSGQISLNASMAPPVNSAYIYYDANVPSPPFIFAKSGINNTWDFSVLNAVPGADDTLFILPPSSVPGGAAFPAATHCTYEGADGSRDMMQVNTAGVTLLGFIGDPLGIGTPGPIPLNPPATTMNFPYTYGSNLIANTYMQLTNTGAAIGQPNYDSIRYKSSFSANVVVIAAGDIILPSGTFPALLERRISTILDSAWVKGAITLNQWVLAPGFPQSNTDSAFYWYSNQSLLHYAHALYDDTGLHDVHYYKSQITTGLNDSPGPGNMASVFPNPSSSVLHVKIPGLPAISHWSVFTIEGKKLLEGVNDISRINIQGLHNGTYLLYLSDINGQTYQTKFIKN